MSRSDLTEDEMTEIQHRISENALEAFDQGRRIGRVEALEEVLAICVGGQNCSKKVRELLNKPIRRFKKRSLAVRQLSISLINSVDQCRKDDSSSQDTLNTVQLGVNNFLLTLDSIPMYNVIIGTQYKSECFLETDDEQEALAALRVNMAECIKRDKSVFGRIDKVVNGIVDAIWMAV